MLAVLFYGVVSAQTEKVVECFLKRDAAEAMIGEVREDEPVLAEVLRVEAIESGRLGELSPRCRRLLGSKAPVALSVAAVVDRIAPSCVSANRSAQPQLHSPEELSGGASCRKGDAFHQWRPRAGVQNGAAIHSEPGLAQSPRSGRRRTCGQ